MNQAVKHLSILSVAVIVAQVLGKFFYFNSFRFFTFEIGYLSLIETGLIFLFIYFFQKELALFPDQRKLEKVKAQNRVLFLVLSFFAGVHLVGGEFQNFFIFRRSFGEHMDMATFYDGLGHLFLFSIVLVLIYWLVKAEVAQPLSQKLSKSELGLVLVQSFILSLGLALTVIKSALILFYLVPILALAFYFLLTARKRKTFSAKVCSLHIFFSALLTLTFIWLLVWLVLPPDIQRPFIEEYISLPDDYEIRTVLTEIPLLKSITRIWD